MKKFTFDATRDYPKVTESKAIIRFQDCDPLGHLNNAKYFDYFFNAREDQFLAMHGNIATYFLVGYPVNTVFYNHQIAYVRSAVVSEIVWVRSSLIYFDEHTTVEEYYMLDEQRSEIKSLLWSVAKCVNEQGRMASFPQEIMLYLDKVCYREVNYPDTAFNDRIKQIKQSLKK